MIRSLLLLFIAFLSVSISHAQTVTDSSIRDSQQLRVDTVARDTTGPVTAHKKRMSNPVRDSTYLDSVRRAIARKILLLHELRIKDSIAMDSPLQAFNPGTVIPIYQVNTGPSRFMKTLADQPDYQFIGRGQRIAEEIHQVISYDSIFYLLVGILFYFAFFKVLFGKYLRNLFTLFFLVSMRQQQIREQVLQSPLPSLLLNILFVITGGLYVSFLIRSYQFAQNTGFWFLLFDSVAVLSVVYLCKFLFLKFSGWIFKISRATDMYIFIIFLTNKVLGIFLLPFLLILSFSGSTLREVTITASLIMIAIFFAYRFSVSFNPVRKEIKVRGFHFLLYLCAFELAPLLLIYKVLLSYLEKAY